MSSDVAEQVQTGIASENVLISQVADGNRISQRVNRFGDPFLKRVTSLPTKNTRLNLQRMYFI